MLNIRMAFIIAPMCLLSGCDTAMDIVGYVLLGHKESYSVVERLMVEVGREPLDYDLPDPMPLAGQSLSVCLVLGDGIELPYPEESDELVTDLTNRGLVWGEVTLSNGVKAVDTGVLSSWSENGHILGAKELSGCLHYIIQGNEGKDVTVDKVSISSDKSFMASGIYLESDNHFDK